MLVYVLTAAIAAAVTFLISFWRRWPSPERFWPGKVVILTGASDGIGAELAVLLAHLGARVAICARREDKLLETQKRMLADGRAAKEDTLALTCDVSDEEQCRILVERTVEKWGRLDVLILNAAKSDVIPFQRQKDASWLALQTMKVNYMQCVYLTRFALQHLKQSTGIIVAVSSIAGLLGSYGSSAYSASKHAIHGFFKCLRLELGDSVACMILPLPFVQTKMAHDNLRPKDPNFGMPSEQCACIMADVIPTRKRQYIMTWETWFGVQLGKLAPAWIESMSLGYLQKNFHVTADFISAAE